MKNMKGENEYCYGRISQARRLLTREIGPSDIALRCVKYLLFFPFQAANFLPVSSRSYQMAPLVANSSAVHPQQLCLPPRLHNHRWSFSLPSPRCANSSEPFLPGVADPLGNSTERSKGKSRVFFLDVNPLCFDGSQPSLRSFSRWVDLFFSRVSLRDPVIAVSSNFFAAVLGILKTLTSHNKGCIFL